MIDKGSATIYRTASVKLHSQKIFPATPQMRDVELSAILLQKRLLAEISAVNPKLLNTALTTEGCHIALGVGLHLLFSDRNGSYFATAWQALLWT